MRPRGRPPRPALLVLAIALGAGLAPVRAAAAPIHTTWLWHMHQPIYWPDRSPGNGKAYEFAHETIALGHSQSDVFSIFNSDDRVHDYQDYPRDALGSLFDLPDAGAQVSFAGSLIQNVASLGAAGWNGGRYASNWYQPYRDAMGWTTSGGRRRLDPVIVAFHHPIAPLVDDQVLRRMIQAQKAIMPGAWGSPTLSTGYFPAEMCFSERMIPILAAEGIQWSIVPDVHIARACADYPYAANQDNCDPPNRADQVNPAQGFYYAQNISRGVTTKVPAPYGLQPHRAQYVDPASGAVSSLIVVPAANGMSWNEGYGSYGTGEIDAIAARNDPNRPMLVLFAHDGDNAFSGGYSYFHETAPGFAHAAAATGYEPTTVAEYLADHPVPADDLVHVEDGGWVNADGDFGSPQFINWNWPLVSASGQFDIPNGWAEDERNWAVLTAATNRVLTAEQIAGVPLMSRVVDPTQPGTTEIEKAWHFLLVGFESGYMYYGSALDFEIKASIAANRALEHAEPLLAGGPDLTPPTIWLPQRLPWNPGGTGGGSLWGYPGGAGAAMTQDFTVWTFVDDVSGVDSVHLVIRSDLDGANPLASIQNETYAGGAEVAVWQRLPMNRRVFPAGDVYNRPDIDFTVMPARIADQYWLHLTGNQDVLLDYYVEARDSAGNLRRSPIQHVYVGTGGTSGGPAVTWEPAAPVAGGTLTIRYDAVAGALPDNTSPVRIHIGHSGWTNVVAPDPSMTWDAGTSRWTYIYGIPAGATSVDFVFNNGAGQWDNNGGADWHVAVSGGAPPAHVIDGTLDTGLTPVASCGGRDLYADYDGETLYLAAPGVGATSGLDHFVLVSRTAGATHPAPWAKAGTVAAWELLLGNEDGNNWNGWFNGAEAVVSSATVVHPGLQQAAGSSLEGDIDVAAVWGSAPPSVWVAFAGYGTANGGTLQSQAPCGNGNGDLEALEWIEVTPHGPLAVPEPARPTAPIAIRLLSPNPSSGVVRARIDAGTGASVTVELLDITGRRLAPLYEGPARGPFEVAADLRRSAGASAGIVLLSVRSDGRRAVRRLALVP